MQVVMERREKNKKTEKKIEWENSEKITKLGIINKMDYFYYYGICAFVLIGLFIYIHSKYSLLFRTMKTRTYSDILNSFIELHIQSIDR